MIGLCFDVENLRLNMHHCTGQAGRDLRQFATDLPTNSPKRVKFAANGLVRTRPLGKGSLTCWDRRTPRGAVKSATMRGVAVLGGDGGKLPTR